MTIAEKIKTIPRGARPLHKIVLHRDPHSEMYRQYGADTPPPIPSCGAEIQLCQEGVLDVTGLTRPPRTLVLRLWPVAGRVGALVRGVDEPGGNVAIGRYRDWLGRNTRWGLQDMGLRLKPGRRLCRVTLTPR